MKSLIVLLVLPFLFSCNEEVRDLGVEQGYEFFPISSGQYRIYEVSEVKYVGAVADSNHYFLKEVVTDSLVTENKTVSYLLKRFIAEDTVQSPWKVDSVWTIRRSVMQGIVTENNVPFVKMVFPVKAGHRWNGNALNSRPSQMYYYDGEIEGFTLNDEQIPAEDLIRVVIEDISKNLVEQDERSEVYARGIGLIEKDYISVHFCQRGCSPGEIEDGRIFRQHLVKYGEE